MNIWRFFPTTLYAFAALIGSCLVLYPIYPLFHTLVFFFLALPCIFGNNRATLFRSFLAFCLAFSCFYLTSVRYLFPENLPSKPGIAEVKISSIRLAKTPFGIFWNYNGVLESFLQEPQKNVLAAKNIPVTVTIPFEKGTHLPANQYRILGKLKKTSKGKYMINPAKGEPWIPLKQLYNLAEWRFESKSSVQRHIEQSIGDKHVAAFLSGIATGEFDDRLLSFELGRFGLQHLMAISGLHFSLLSAMIGVALGIIFPRSIAALITVALMTAYFIFLGPTASVTRAWIAITMGLSGLFIQRQSSGINAWGTALLVLMLWNPLIVEEIGFQFSFGVTAAILLWFSPCDHFLQWVFAKRNLSLVVKMDLWDQHGYCMLHFIRQGLALCIAVNLIALPLALYHFHKFPVMSLVYNLFFPLLMSFSLILLIIAFGSSLVAPWLGNLLHSLNESYTQFILNFAFNLPRSFDITWHVKAIPEEALMVYALILFAVGLYLQKRITSLPLA